MNNKQKKTIVWLISIVISVCVFISISLSVDFPFSLILNIFYAWAVGTISGAILGCWLDLGE